VRNAAAAASRQGRRDDGGRASHVSWRYAACRAIAEARSIDEVMAIRDEAAQLATAAGREMKSGSSWRPGTK